MLHCRCTPLTAAVHKLQAFDHPSIDSIATFLAESQLLPAPTVAAAAQAPVVTASSPMTSSHPTAPAVPLATQLPSPQAPHTPPATLIIASAFKAPGAASPNRVFSWQQYSDTAGPGASMDGSSVVPLARWDVDLVLPSHMPGELQARFGCFLEGVEAFDPESVGMTPAEALLVDPQQRLVMEAFGDVVAATTAAGLYTK